MASSEGHTSLFEKELSKYDGLKGVACFVTLLLYQLGMLCASCSLACFALEEGRGSGRCPMEAGIDSSQSTLGAPQLPTPVAVLNEGQLLCS